MLATVGLLVTECAFWQPSRNRHVPQPARSVDLPRYLGRWYELARYDSSFERGCDHVTATYTARPDGLIGVANACLRDGHTVVARGRARVVPNSGGTKLKVSFFGPFFVGNYWVMDHGADYDWSIVGEGSGGYLWILARDPHPAPGLRAALIRQVAAMGYDTSRLRLTAQ